MTTSARTYTVRVDGHLDDHWSSLLGDVTVRRGGDGTTTLHVPVADQARLHGLLSRIRDIGATILELRALTECEETPGRRREGPGASSHSTRSASNGV